MFTFCFPYLFRASFAARLRSIKGIDSSIDDDDEADRETTNENRPDNERPNLKTDNILLFLQFSLLSLSLSHSFSLLWLRVIKGAF